MREMLLLALVLPYKAMAEGWANSKVVPLPPTVDFLPNN
jgi:hypothetical protein